MKKNWDGSSQAWIDFSDLKKWASANDVKIFATFPNMVDFPAYHPNALKTANEYLQSKYKSLGIPTLGSPGDYLFPKDDFYDTIYHMNHEGALKRTAILLKYLQPQLAKNSPTSH